MKTTGMVRKVDELGRIVLPIEIRRTLGISVKDELEILVKNQSIVLTKYETSCIFCGGTEGLVDYKNKQICSKCAKNIKEL